MTFLEETINVLGVHEKQSSDVLWVGDKEGHMTWEEFASVADFVYGCDYGLDEIYAGVVIVGDEFWLERVYDDECEGIHWEFRESPKKPVLKVEPNKGGFHRKFCGCIDCDNCDFEASCYDDDK